MAETRDLLFRFLGDARDLANASRSAKSSLNTVDDAQKQTTGGLKGLAASTKALVAGGAALVASGVVRFLSDATRAALEDAQAQTQLKLALQNTTGATDEQVAAAENYIDATARATGVTDDELRPALAELTRSTGSVEEAQRLLGDAMDISTAKGLPLETVVKAIGKAANGNVGALGRINVNVRDAAGGFVDFETAMDNARATMGGAMAAAAETAEGRLKRVSVAVDEAKEQLGSALIPVVGAAADALIQFSIEVRQWTGDISDMDAAIQTWEQHMGTSADTAAAALQIWQTGHIEWADLLKELKLGPGELMKLERATDEYLFTQGLTNETIDEFRGNTRKAIAASLDARGEQTRQVDSLQDVEGGYTDAASAAQEYIDKQRALVDPLFAVFDATKAATEANQKYIDAVAESGEDSIEARDATRELAGAMAALDAANKLYAEEGGPASEEALRDLAERGGAADDSIRNLIDTATIWNQVKFRKPPWINTGRGDVGRSGTAQHTGGFLGPGAVARVGELGPETIMVGHPGATIFPHRNGNGTAPPAVVNQFTITGFIGSEARLAAEIDRILTLRARRSGLGFQGP